MVDKIHSLNPEIANFKNSKGLKSKSDIKTLGDILRGKSPFKSKLSFKKTQSSIQSRPTFQSKGSQSKFVARLGSKSDSKSSSKQEYEGLTKQTTWLDSFHSELEATTSKADAADALPIIVTGDDENQDGNEGGVNGGIYEEKEDGALSDEESDEFANEAEDQVSFNPMIPRRATAVLTSTSSSSSRRKSFNLMEKELNRFRKFSQDRFSNEASAMNTTYIQ